jgi:5-methylcytosine-specific restriction endonuclease McrA
MGKNMPTGWSRVKAKWRERNLPDKDGNYVCWICKQPVHNSVVTIDHVAPLELYPEYARDLSNLKPSHRWCNEERGRPGHTKLLKRYGRRKVGRL